MYISVWSVSSKEFNETEEEFEKEFGIKIFPLEARQRAEEILFATEEEINKVNIKYDEGTGTYSARLYSFSNMEDEEFIDEYEGLIMPSSKEEEVVPMRYLGLIDPPDHVKNDPENAARMNEIHRQLQF